jgi:predicted permease
LLHNSLWRDTRHAVLRLARDWPFALAAALILAVGIGANTAVFSVVNAGLFRPQSFAQTDRLVNIYQNGEKRVPGGVSFPAYLDIAQQSDIFTAVAAGFAGVEARYQAPDRLRPAVVEFTTSSYLATLGLAPARGRWFNAQEDGSAAAPVAVIGYRTWRDRYGADPGILGRLVRINGSQVTIVGIAPEALHNSTTAAIFTEFWLPMSGIAPLAGNVARSDLFNNRDTRSFQVKARLRDGVTLEQSQAAIDVLAARFKADHPDSDPGQGMTVLRAKDVRFSPPVDAMVAPAALVLLAIVGLVLAIACSNLATLMLVRGTSRAQEISVRLALGATRWQVVRHLLVESLLLATVGAAGGWLLADWGVRLMSTVETGFSIDIGLDYRVLGYAVALSLITGIGSGLAPAMVSTRVGLAPALREQNGTSSSRGWFTLKNALIVAQVTASFLLLMATGFGVRTIANATRQDLGYAIDGLAILETDTHSAGYNEVQARALMNDLVRRIETIPGVEAVLATNGTPPGEDFNRRLILDGYQPLPGEEDMEISGGWAPPGFFEILRIPVLYGRTFDANDRPGTPEVTVINETMARRYFGSPNAVGRRLRYGTLVGGAVSGQVEVVGVVADTREADDFEGVHPSFYLSVVQAGNVPTTVVARTSLDDGELAGRMQAELRKLDAALPVLNSGTMRHFNDRGLTPWRVGGSY